MTATKKVKVTGFSRNGGFLGLNCKNIRILTRLHFDDHK